METRKASVNRASSLEISGPHSILHQTSEREERLSKCFTYIFVTFAVCFTPWAILTTVDPIPPSTLGWLHMATYILSWSSAFINPIIYGVCNSNYQNAFKNLIEICCCKSRNVNDITRPEDQHLKGSIE